MTIARNTDLGYSKFHVLTGKQFHEVLGFTEQTKAQIKNTGGSIREAFTARCGEDLL